MLRIFRIAIVFLAVVITVSAARRICTHLIRQDSSLVGFNNTQEVQFHDSISAQDPGDYFMNDTIYEWDNRLLDWVYAGIVDEMDVNVPIVLKCTN